MKLRQIAGAMKKKRLKVWSGVIGVALAVALILTLVPVGVTITGEGMLGLDLSTTSAQISGTGGMAYATLEKSGCEERRGNVKIRLDFYLEPSDPRYDDTYIPIVDPETEEPTGEYQLVPFHTHFVYFTPDVTVDDIKAEMAFHLPNFYKAFQDRWDEVNGGMRHGWATETRIKPTDYSKTESAAEYDARVAGCQAAIDSLTEFSYKPEGEAEGKEYPATAITIGPGAINRGFYHVSGSTLIDKANPANDTGIIDTFEVWAAQTLSGTNKVGTFHGSGTDYTNRDGEAIGTVTQGAKRTFTGLTIDVSTGDFAGIYYSAGMIEYELSGGADVYRDSGDQFGTGEQTYVWLSADVFSIYGTGETAPVCSEDISNTPSSWSVNSGTPVNTSSEYATGLTHFQITNNSGGAVDISISGTDMTGGNTWTLSDTATPGSMTYGLKAGLSGGDYTIIVKKNSPYNDLVTGLADSGTQQWGLKLYTPTVHTDGASKSMTTTITATCV